MKPTRPNANAKRWIAILGCESGIARACAHRWAREGWNLHLASRNKEEASRTAADLALRYGIQAKAWAFDAVDYPTHAGFWKKCAPAPTGVLAAFGTLGDHDRALRDGGAARFILDANFTGAVSILTAVADDFGARKKKRASEPFFIAAISSVAGERGRRSNYLYGSAKAGLTAFLSGLRSRLQPAGIPVLTVIPGFVRTDMTAGVALPPLVTAEPDEVARAIVRSVKKRADVVWVRPVWRLIFLVLRHLPESIFKRLSF
ncbi:MAG: SDR family oxidoreductase [Spirochaetes bacterium]|nr:SDR family oxidoreductase [Spirochaetota bacterium]